MMSVRFSGRVVIACTVLVMGVSACQNEAAQAEQRYEMVKERGDIGSVCKAAREVESIYFKANKANEWEQWHTQAEIECAEAERVGELMPANKNY